MQGICCGTVKPQRLADWHQEKPLTRFGGFFHCIVIKNLYDGMILTNEVEMPEIRSCEMDWLCVHCGQKQSVYVGDPEDFTIPDVEAVRCFSCKKIELTTDPDEFIYSSSEPKAPTS
jgi:hypothetical protein